MIKASTLRPLFNELYDSLSNNTFSKSSLMKLSHITELVFPESGIDVTIETSLDEHANLTGGTQLIESAAESQYDDKGNAAHYKNTRLDTMVIFERTFGTEALMMFCEITALKYRMRIGNKPGQPIDQEITKCKWYETKAKELFERLNTPEEIVINNRVKIQSNV